MVREANEATEFRQRLLATPSERRDVEYKRSVPFEDGTEFSLKRVRPLQGMGNAGGGWIVIGYREQESGWAPDPGHRNEICGSYDPTQLCRTLDSYVGAGQRMKVEVHLERHPHLDLAYPIISVQSFSRTPFVCRSTKYATDTGKRILDSGVVYLRRPAAETTKVSTAEDWEDLIEGAIRGRRDEFLHEFRDLFERMTSPAAPQGEPLEALDDRLGGRQADFRGSDD